MHTTEIDIASNTISSDRKLSHRNDNFYVESLHTDCLSKKSSEERIISVYAPNKIEISKSDEVF